MIPAFGMVILPQNPSTENGRVPGWSCILSVDYAWRLEALYSGDCVTSCLVHAGLLVLRRFMADLSQVEGFMQNVLLYHCSVFLSEHHLFAGSEPDSGLSRDGVAGPCGGVAAGSADNGGCLGVHAR